MILKSAKILGQTGEFQIVDIEIEDGKIKQVANLIEGSEQIDIGGKLVVPAFIDVHTHTRNPGQSYKETIESISNAALAGGYSTLFAMPNTNPVIDTPDKLAASINNLNNQPVKFYQYGALSSGLTTTKLLDYKAMKQAGAIALSNDGHGVQATNSIYQMMQKCIEADLTYVSHSEVDDLLNGGVMHHGTVSAKLGLPGILASVEAVAVAKEITLATELGCKYHICHMSSKMSVDLLRLHKQYQSKVTGEVTPHHLLLCDEDILSDDPNFKMNPPLRSKADRQALIDGLNDKTIEIIATDHAPHSQDDKGQSFIGSAFGIVGLETAFNLMYTYLVLPGMVSLKTIVDAMTINPATIFGIDGGIIAPGASADLTVIDLDSEQVIDSSKFQSLGRNTPFNGYKVKSKICQTIIKGEIQWKM